MGAKLLIAGVEVDTDDAAPSEPIAVKADGTYAKTWPEQVVAELGELKTKWLESAKADHPELTDEQLAGAWDQVAHQLGL
jgi:hypothetical protein